jgi:hypothetical protein
MRLHRVARSSSFAASTFIISLLAVTAGGAQAATVNANADFHVTVVADGDTYHGDIVVSALQAQDGSGGTSSTNQGIAVVTMPGGNDRGTWSYSADGNAWAALGTDLANGNKVLLLPGTAHLRFAAKIAGFNRSSDFATGFTALTFRTVDQVTDIVGTKLKDLNAKNVSNAIGSVSLNRAPTICTDDALVTTTSTNANAIAQRITWSQATTGLSIDHLITDQDAQAYRGLAIEQVSTGQTTTSETSASPLGDWYFLPDGSSATAQKLIPGDSTAMLAGSLTGIGTLRFVPTSDLDPAHMSPDHPPTIAYRGWDMTNLRTSDGARGTAASGNQVVLSTTFAPSGAFSTSRGLLTVVLNHAPVVSSSAFSVTPDAVLASGTTTDLALKALTTSTTTPLTVAELIRQASGNTDAIDKQGHAVDADGERLGILVTKDAPALYHASGKGTPTPLVAGTYLSSDALLYVKPTAIGSRTIPVSFILWDGTDGAKAGSVRATLPTGGGITAFSATTATAAIAITAQPTVTWNRVPDGSAHVGTAFSCDLHATSTCSDLSVTISPSTDPLPAGLILSATSGGKATLSGSPSQAGTRTVRLCANDGYASASTAFTLTVTTNSAVVPIPALPVATGTTTPAYTAIGLPTPEAVDSFLAAIAGKNNTQVRAFAFSSTDQQYVELPLQPVEGLLDHAVFVVTRVALSFSLNGTPQSIPAALTLQPGWNFLTIPVLTSDGADAITSHDWNLFCLTDANGKTVSNPANAIGTTGSNDLATTRPYVWTGSAYIQTSTLTSGVGYWFKNNTSTTLQLVRQATAGNLASAHLTPQTLLRAARSEDAATVTDRGTPPAPPASSASANDNSHASGCGLGSGIAGFALLVLTGLRIALRHFNMRKSHP